MGKMFPNQKKDNFMPIPATTKVWPETMDPYDIVDYQVDLAPVLATAESIVSYTVAAPAESELYGLTIGTGTRAPALVGTNLTLWLSIDSALQTSPAFIKGLTLPIEITITTNSTPSRRKQRTVAVKVLQR